MSADTRPGGGAKEEDQRMLSLREIAAALVVECLESPDELEEIATYNMLGSGNAELHAQLERIASLYRIRRSKEAGNMVYKRHFFSIYIF